MKQTVYAFICALLIGGTAQAQTIIGSTTLNGNVTVAQTTLTLTSATGGTSNGATFTLTVGYEYVIVDEAGFEAGVITAISGSTISVRRGTDGTQVRSHDTGTLIFIGPTTAFYKGPPGTGSGTYPGFACTRAQLQYLPWFDLTSGLIWSCGSQGAPATASTWSAVNSMPITFGTTGWLR